MLQTNEEILMTINLNRIKKKRKASFPGTVSSVRKVVNNEDSYFH